MTSSGASEKDGDLTGKSRLARNTITSWATYMVLIAAGFLMPRAIDRTIGQSALGLWDFCWSLVNYLSMSNLGIGASTNRYIAKYRAAGKTDGIVRIVSSVLVMQWTIALIVALATVALTFLLPYWFADRIQAAGASIVDARWVVLFLGLSLAIEMAMDSSRGVLTGYHRWDLHNTLNIGSRVVEILLMLVVLLFTDWALVGLAVVHLGVVIGTEAIRFRLSRIISPEARFSFSQFEWSLSKELLFFGSKHIFVGIPSIVTMQTISVSTMFFGGPALLAVLMRSLALVKHVEMFVSRYTWVLTPMVGAMHTSDANTELREFVLKSSQTSLALTLPPVIFLSIFGDDVLRLWMGPDYVNAHVMVILAFGILLPVSQNVMLNALIGMNRHGRVGVLNFFVTGATLSVGIWAVHATGGSLIAIALCLAITQTVGLGILVPIYACRVLGIRLSEYVSRVFPVPVVCNCIFAACLLICRYIVGAQFDFVALALGLTAAGGVLAALYWTALLPAAMKQRVAEGVKRTVLLMRRIVVYDR